MNYYKNPEREQWKKLVKRPSTNNEDLSNFLKELFDDIEQNGDKALTTYATKFDKFNGNVLVLNQEGLTKLADRVEPSLRLAIEQAARNIRQFHVATAPKKSRIIETADGIKCWQELRPIQKIGLYVPGGTAPLISTVLMLAIPAQIAGSQQVILCTPAKNIEELNPAICFAAQLAGIKRIFCIGGPQAIAAMAIGTETIPKVDKIFGPGNQFVTAAKLFSQNYDTAIDMPAGPSEMMVVADSTADPAFVAADLLSQAEHGIDSQVMLVTTDEIMLTRIEEELQIQIDLLPRKEIAAKSLENSVGIYFSELKTALQFANTYAPEHLILSVQDAENVAGSITDAGSIFLGNYSPESAGDYATGPNHTLPTKGWAKTYSGLSVKDFCKTISFQSLTKEGLLSIESTVATLANAEGLTAHARAVSIRNEKNKYNRG